MADEVIEATSEEPSAEDVRLRKLVTDLISQQNKAMIDLAKSMLTITFTAIGVVLALHKDWFGVSRQTGDKVLVVGALVTLLLSVPVYLIVIRGYRMAVSTTDYQRVEEELSRLATLRSRLVNAGMALTGLAAVLLAIAIV
jgi:hypothetical protein